MAKRTKSKSSRKHLPWWRITAVTLAAVMVLWGANVWLNGGATKGKSFQVTGGETRPVLNPFLFASGRVALAYAAARKYPEVLDQIFCYCLCDQPPFNHKSLLSCFTNYHGSS